MDLFGFVFGWGVTAYLCWHARHGVRSDVRRLRGLVPSRRGRYASRGGL